MTRGAELPRATQSETGRTEPGTWREIIARFERELGPAPDADSPAEAAPPSEAPTGDELPPGADADIAGVEERPELVTPADVANIADVDEAETVTSPAGPDIDDTTGRSPPPADIEDTAEPVPSAVDAEVEEIAPGALPSLDDAVPWEIAAMTTPDYTPPPSIHDREHDSWPVDTEDGDAVPAWTDDVPEQRAPASMGDALAEIGELLLDDEAPTDPWDADTRPRDAADGRSDFPLDAFIVPAGVHHAPTGYDADVARRVALRLDELARQLRGDGLQSLGRTGSTDELSRVLAAIVTGFVARDD
ncbi:MAG TPA: hypothetical protein VK933_04635 [Longimicrobiales bacterium]|nr:hypothetical protein [Longimicrobiales bacterium]